jgi:hypothetical protein
LRYVLEAYGVDTEVDRPENVLLKKAELGSSSQEKNVPLATGGAGFDIIGDATFEENEDVSGLSRQETGDRDSN